MQQPETNRREATIEKWVYGGRGLGRVNGQTLLVPYVLAGETVRVDVERERRGLLEGRLIEVLAPSDARVSPPCAYFMRCGGCHYQHASYESQLAGKVDVLRETLQRVGKLEAPAEIGTLSASPFEYRNRVQFHLAGGEIGFLQAGSTRLCPVERCPISSPAINSALEVLRKMIRDRRFPRFLRSIELFTNESEVQVNVLESDRPVARHFFDWCAEGIPGAAAGSLEYPAAGTVFRVSHRSFFQVNRYLIDTLVDAALGEAAGDMAADLYAGVGLFAVALGRRFGTVTAVESGASAARDLEFNTERAAAPVRSEKSTVEAWLEGLERAPDFVLADPPRSGMGKGVVRQLLRLMPPRITIVACDPATLARDLGPLIEAGFWIEGMTLIDLFPQTYHIETITHLERR